MKNTFPILILCAISLSAHAMDSLESQFEKNQCNGDCRSELMVDYDPSGPVSAVEHFVLQKYTEENRVLSEEIMLSAVQKLPKKVVKVYRGGSKGPVKSVGQVIVLKALTSVSLAREVAEGFIQDQLMIIRAKTGRDISRYSVTGEQELILLPGTRLRVDRISNRNLNLGYGNEIKIQNVQIVEMTELE